MKKDKDKLAQAGEPALASNRSYHPSHLLAVLRQPLRRPVARVLVVRNLL